jgi:hypothetical protein
MPWLTPITNERPHSVVAETIFLSGHYLRHTPLGIGFPPPSHATFAT